MLGLRGWILMGNLVQAIGRNIGLYPSFTITQLIINNYLENFTEKS